MSIASRIFTAAALLAVASSSLGQGPSASISYIVAQAPVTTAASVNAEPIPVLANGALLVLGLMLALLGVRSLRKSASAAASKFAVAAIGLGLASSLGSGAWLVGNAQALPATTQYLFSTAANPLVVDQIPAGLENDLATQVTLQSINISGCPGDTDLQGTCAEGLALAAEGGSCTIDSLCATISGTCGNSTLDTGEEFDPPPGPFTSAPVDAQSCRYDFSNVPQFYCNGSCSISGSSGCDQTEADRFCKLKLDNPDAVATSFTTTTALAEPGFGCYFGAQYGTQIDMTSRGVTETIRYQDSSILANHGPGTVIDSVVCAVP